MERKWRNTTTPAAAGAPSAWRSLAGPWNTGGRGQQEMTRLCRAPGGYIPLGLSGNNYVNRSQFHRNWTVQKYNKYSVVVHIIRILISRISDISKNP